MPFPGDQIRRRTASLGQAAQWALVAALLVGGGVGLGLLGEPAAVLVWAMVISAACALSGFSIRVGRMPVLLAQLVTATLVGRLIDAPMLGQVLGLWHVVLIVSVLVVASSGLVGALVARSCGLDPAVGAWGFMPGMASIMISMADDRGLDGRMVAIMQLTRLVVIILGMVGLSAVLGVGPDDALPGVQMPGPTLAGLAWLPTLMVVGLVVDRYVKIIPAVGVLLTLCLAAAVTTSGEPAIYLPPALVDLAFSVIGLQIGLRFSPDLLARGWRALPRILLGSFALILVSAALGAVVAQLAGVGMVSGLLSTLPGSMDSIGALVVSTGASVSLVMTLQTVRLLMLTSAGPFIADWLGRRLARPIPADDSDRSDLKEIP